MGTPSTKKFIKNNAGTLAEEAALTTSSGASDADRIPALNSDGVLDASITNATVISAGAGDAGKLPRLDASGRIDNSVLPVGIGADTAQIVASETLAAGDLVNIWNDAGTAKARKADGSTSGKEAHGFVLSGFASAATATVYFEGTNTQGAALTPGVQFLSDTVPGKTQASAPLGAGKIVQRVGFALSATEINFDADQPIILA